MARPSLPMDVSWIVTMTVALAELAVTVLDAQFNAFLSCDGTRIGYSFCLCLENFRDTCCTCPCTRPVITMSNNITPFHDDSFL